MDSGFRSVVKDPLKRILGSVRRARAENSANAEFRGAPKAPSIRFSTITWPWNTGRSKFAPAAGRDTEATEPTRHSSPGLKAALETLPSDGSGWVLDLGSAVAGNLEFLSSIVSRVQVVDLLGFRFHTEGASAVDADGSSALLQDLEPEFARTFHLVLVWDLLNYHSPERGRKLIEQLTRLCRPDGWIFASVVSSETMPTRPNRFRIVGHETLAYEATSDELQGGPQLTPAAVERLVKGFQIEHSFVLRHGYREYLAVRG